MKRGFSLRRRDSTRSLAAVPEVIRPSTQLVHFLPNHNSHPNYDSHANHHSHPQCGFHIMMTDAAKVWAVGELLRRSRQPCQPSSIRQSSGKSKFISFKMFIKIKWSNDGYWTMDMLTVSIPKAMIHPVCLFSGESDLHKVPLTAALFRI